MSWNPASWTIIMSYSRLVAPTRDEALSIIRAKCANIAAAMFCRGEFSRS